MVNLNQTFFESWRKIIKDKITSVGHVDLNLDKKKTDNISSDTCVVDIQKSLL